MNELALFAGAGGGILGGKLLGWRTVCAVEWEPYPASVLCARQNDGLLPPFPIWDDVQTFDGKPWAGIVDVVSGGFPCQDISIAGKGDGLDGERSGLWREMARVVGEVRPRYVYIENSPMLTIRGGTRVIADLTSLGYDTQWDVMGAADVGAPHQRDRIWIVAHTTSAGRDERSIPIKGGDGRSHQERSSNFIKQPSKTSSLVADSNGSWQLQPKGFEQDKRGWTCNSGDEMADADSAQCKRDERTKRTFAQHANIDGTSWWKSEPNVGRVANGVAARVDRLKAIGNGQVPAVAATAWSVLK